MSGGFSEDADIWQRRSSLLENRDIDLLRKLLSSAVAPDSPSESTLSSLHCLGFRSSPLAFRSRVISVISFDWDVRREATYRG